MPRRFPYGLLPCPQLHDGSPHTRWVVGMLTGHQNKTQPYLLCYSYTHYSSLDKDKPREFRKCLPQQDPPPGEVSHYSKPGSCPVTVASTTTNKRYRIEGSSGPDPDHNGRKEHQHGIECHPVLIPTITDVRKESNLVITQPPC